MHVPVLVDPVGDPAGVRVGARRLAGAAESITATARGLSDLNQQAVQAWESSGQRLFSILAGEFSRVIAGSSGVTTDITDALDRYANILESCQNDVRLCRQRLQSLVSSTPVGMVPDPAAVNTIVGQANEAYTRAAQAAKELSATALNLIGNPTGNGAINPANDAHATFISQAHSGGLASTHPSAAAFNAQAAHIQTQMNGVVNTLGATALDAGANLSQPGTELDYQAQIMVNPTSPRVGVDPNAVPPPMLTVPFGSYRPTQVVSVPGGASGDGLVMVAAPYSIHGTGTGYGIMVDTSIKANTSFTPTGLSPSTANDMAYQQWKLENSIDPTGYWIKKSFFDDPGRIDPYVPDDVFEPFHNITPDPYDNY